MIKQLNIQNFQSHKDTSIDFSDGVNIIVGASDSGKSAIIRALKWLHWNRPSGDAIRSNWGGKTEVELFTDDCHVIRSKNKEELYVLGDQSFRAFRTEVPEEIVKALNMQEINLQQQLDSPFLLSLTPGQVAEHFNKVAKLEQIDKATSAINKAIRELETERKYKITDLENKEEEFKKFEYLDKFEATVEVLEGMEKEYDNLWKSRTKLGTLLLDYGTVQKDIELSSQILADEDKVNNLLSLYDKKEKLIEQQEGIYSILEDISQVLKDIDEAKELTNDEVTVNNLLSLYDDKKVLDKSFLTLRKALLDLNGIDLLLNKKVADLGLKQAQFKKEMPDICPLCGNVTRVKYHGNIRGN
jgi:DNA repair exonuclease SbcCD ATPase subunit